MIYSEERDPDRRLPRRAPSPSRSTSISASATRGGIELTTGAQRLYAFGTGIDFPLVLSATANVHEWYDETADTYRIAVRVTNPIVGLVFEYSGSFDVEWIDCETAPDEVRPVSPTRGE